MRHFIEVLPHYIGGLAAILLAVFAFMAWRESIQTTAALQGQLNIMKLDQRPLLWIVDVEGPAFEEATGQVHWRVAVANIGKGIAYRMVSRKYIKVGSERYQTERTIGINAVELGPTQPNTVPPNIFARNYADIFSRAGISKEFYARMLATNLALGILIEFDYTDASGETRFHDAVCHERFATGAYANVPPENCRKDH
jgi:hypothetical protein